MVPHDYRYHTWSVLHNLYRYLCSHVYSTHTVTTHMSCSPVSVQQVWHHSPPDSSVWMCSYVRDPWVCGIRENSSVIGTYEHIHTHHHSTLCTCMCGVEEAMIYMLTIVLLHTKYTPYKVAYSCQVQQECWWISCGWLLLTLTCCNYSNHLTIKAVLCWSACKCTVLF